MISQLASRNLLLAALVTTTACGPELDQAIQARRERVLALDARLQPPLVARFRPNRKRRGVLTLRELDVPHEARTALQRALREGAPPPGAALALLGQCP